MADNRPYTMQMEQLFQQAEKTRNDYANAKDKAKEEVEKLKEEIDSLRAEAKGNYKLYVLNIITLESYEELKQSTDNKSKMLHSAEDKVNSIDALLQEELLNIYRQVKAIERDYQNENDTNIAEQRQVMFQAKNDFLEALHGARNEVIKTDKYEKMIYEIGVETGQRYDSGWDFEDRRVSELIYNPYHNLVAGIDTNRNEIAEAYHRGIVSDSVKKQAGL